MTARVTPLRILGWAALVGMAATGATLAAAVVLAIGYVPVAREMTNPDQGWIVLHASASRILGMACFAAVLVLVWPTGGSRPWRRPLSVGAAVVATGVAAVAIVTLDMVLWEQAALRSVRVGTDIGGNWWAAFGSDVRFLIVDGAEVSQGSYAVVLIVHLLSPLVALGALLTSVAAARRPQVDPDPI